VRQDQEPVLLDAVRDRHGRLLHGQHAGQRALGRLLVETRHRGGHVLWTHDRYTNPALAVCDGQRLSEPHGRVLRDAVGSVADLAQQAGSRRDTDEVARAALEHAGQHGPARVHVRHHVHRPHALPICIGRGQRVVEVERLHPEPGIRDQDVDAPVTSHRRIHGLAHRIGVCDIALQAEPAELDRSRLRHPAVEVGDHDASRAAPHELATQRPPDAASCARHERHLACDLHGSELQEARQLELADVIAVHLVRAVRDAQRP